MTCEDDFVLVEAEGSGGSSSSGGDDSAGRPRTLPLQANDKQLQLLQRVNISLYLFILNA